ncbi:MAG: hypothetical protein IJN56_05365 [Clostridia bacterium]|nr:hypothetical protein [Clostridia bacterium]
MKKIICMLIVVLICVGLCACEKDGSNNVNNSSSTDSTSNIDVTNDLPLIETLEFSVNEIVLNSKPEDLYYQICDVYLSPVESLSVAEFMERAKTSSMQLTYNICEDYTPMTYSDYSENYLVTDGESVDIFFYCEEQLVFKLTAKNLSNETIPLKECYAFEIDEMYEYFSKNAVDVKSKSWYCGGVPFGGEGYTYATIKETFSNWGLTCEENTNDNGTLTVYSVFAVKIDVDFQNETFTNYVRYDAVVDKSTGEVVKFSYSH